MQSVSLTKSDCLSVFLIDSVIFIFFSCEYCAFYIFFITFFLMCCLFTARHLFFFSRFLCLMVVFPFALRNLGGSSVAITCSLLDVVQFVSQTKSDCFSAFLIDSVIFIFFSCEYCAFYIFLSPFPLSWNRQICPK